MLSRPSTLHSAAPGVGLSVVRLRIVRPLALLKRSGDLCFALALLTLGSPLLIAIAIAVKCTSQGPVFFVQQRIGRGYRRFGCIKFRTMELDADRRLQSLLASCPQLRAEFEKDHKLRNDPRITPIGQFLRTTSLDELPQLFNILRGQMSVVGPRPIVEEEIPRYGAAMDQVLSVRPGLTGLWQVSGRNNVRYQRRVLLDLSYVNRRSLGLDLFILLRTVVVVLFPANKGAY
ncbi:MAG: sugar transferase [Synechococcus sp. MED-G71]|jgi:lipopolysaccharide/colanic/teichoic acid biosynthesis glycosyltransferase|nr:MAG: sugar transferase [Synechococcus sp. MED-G71]|tara:strand:+ start:279 stop:974 length:696 start_codon:yes stop_codon:yes gene_type:complete